MPGIEQLEGDLLAAGGAVPIERKLPAERHLPPLAHAVVHLAVGEERVVLQAQFLALPQHHVHRVVQHDLAQRGRGRRHEHGRLVLPPGEERQRAEVVVVRMRQKNGVDRPAPEPPEVRHGMLPLALRVHAAVQHDGFSRQGQRVAVRADLDMAGQVQELHRANLKYMVTFGPGRGLYRRCLTSLQPGKWDLQTGAHLLNRAGFGGTPDEIKAFCMLGPEGAVKQVLDAPDDSRAIPQARLGRADGFSRPAPADAGAPSGGAQGPPAGDGKNLPGERSRPRPVVAAADARLAQSLPREGDAFSGTATLPPACRRCGIPTSCGSRTRRCGSMPSAISG